MSLSVRGGFSVENAPEHEGDASSFGKPHPLEADRSARTEIEWVEDGDDKS